MMRRNTGIVLLALLALASQAVAQNSGTILTPEPDIEGTRVGTRGAVFLKQGVGARGLAMGGAFTAASDDVYSLYWNTAGLANLDRFAAAYSYASLFGDVGITHQFAGAAMPMLGGVVGLSGVFFSSGDIPRTTEDFPLGGDPTFGSSFSWSGTAIGLHYGRFITDRLSVGFAGKAITEGMSDASASYFGLDAGVRFDTGIFGTTIGAALTNVGSNGRMDGGALDRSVAAFQGSFDHLRPLEVDLDADEFSLPTAFHFGLETSLIGGPSAVIAPSETHSLLAVVQVDDAIDTALQPAFGAEYAFRDLLFLRAGKKMVNEARDGNFRDALHGLSFGGGVAVPVGGSRSARFDYGFVDMGELQNIQVFSFEFGF